VPNHEEAQDYTALGPTEGGFRTNGAWIGTAVAAAGIHVSVKAQGGTDSEGGIGVVAGPLQTARWLIARTWPDSAFVLRCPGSIVVPLGPLIGHVGVPTRTHLDFVPAMASPQCASMEL
jgi:hypothetical protein